MYIPFPFLHIRRTRREIVVNLVSTHSWALTLIFILLMWANIFLLSQPACAHTRHKHAGIIRLPTAVSVHFLFIFNGIPCSHAVTDVRLSLTATITVDVSSNLTSVLLLIMCLSDVTPTQHREQHDSTSHGGSWYVNYVRRHPTAQSWFEWSERSLTLSKILIQISRRHHS